MNARRFQILQTRRKRKHDLRRAEHRARVGKHFAQTTVEQRMMEAKPKFEYVESKLKTEKPGFFKRLFGKKT